MSGKYQYQSISSLLTATGLSANIIISIQYWPVFTRCLMVVLHDFLLEPDKIHLHSMLSSSKKFNSVRCKHLENIELLIV